jgi:Fur family ferric uptake transcriptional regulator
MRLGRSQRPTAARIQSLLRLTLDNSAAAGYGSAMTVANPIVDALDQAGYRLTGPRRVVADLIAEHNGHFTASDLEAAARSRRLGISRATLFRALDLLTELHVVERLDLPTGEHAYVPCAPAHHHHVICSRCGRTTRVEDCGLAGVVAEVARRSGYEIETHRLELFGLCRHCQAKTSPRN